jgi:acetyl esterase
MEAGVRTIAARYLGISHAFVFFNEIADTPAARAAIAQVAETLRRIFAR